ncbi:hypothetical protein D3C73_1104160 [compost metagenome]
MQPEGPAAGGDIHHAINKLRNFGSQRREFVHDDDEVRGRLRIGFALQRQEVLGFLTVQEPFAVVQLCPKRRQRTAHQVRRQIGHQANGVWEVQAVGKRSSALVVDEQEADPVRAVRGCHAHHPGLQELGLAGTGGSAHQRVRTFVLEVQVERLHAFGADQCAEAAVVLPVGHSCGVDRIVLLPTLRHGLWVVHQFLADQRGVGDGAREVGIVVERVSNIHQRRHHARKLRGKVRIQAFAAHGVRVAAQANLARGGAVIAVHREEVAACCGK